jgi:hypothetical protein
MSDPSLQRDVLEHLWRQFPQHCVILGDPQILRVIDLARERAGAHGFDSTAEVSSWVTLMVYFGSYFDEDPQYPWAGAILRESAGSPREDVLERLYAKTGEVLTGFVGEGGEYYRRALVWARAQSFETISADGGSDDGVQKWLRKAYGRKYDSLPNEGMAGMLRVAEAATRRYGLTTRPGILVYAQLMFLLGSFIDRDPLHPWVGLILQDDALSEPAIKARTLHSRGIRELERYMKLDRITRKE